MLRSGHVLRFTFYKIYLTMGEFMAALYDPLIAPLDPMGVRKWREWVVGAARGRVLELGVGTGLNLPHYRVADSVAAIDPDDASLRRAFSRLNGNRARVALYRASAEELPFAAEAFDAVVDTLVFCSIPNPERALREVCRVLRPGGTFRVVEHVRLRNRILAGAQDVITPVWKEIAGGCHLNRDTLAMIERAGFRVRAVRRHIGGLFIGIDAIK
ncbi:MAG: class I SAM-dependent methyltransferase [Chloroflexi bacterium]|nr:class I SAM-dependent methyltransferase [Chloroflexota bacterium]